MGSPPHGRGTRGDSRAAARRSGLTPAWAGNTPLLPSGWSYVQAHPRMGGEHLGGTSGRPTTRGSPPHGRGTPDGRIVHGGWDGLTPAWAGNTRPSPATPSNAWAHPRMGGEHTAAEQTVPMAPGSPPHGRGTRSRRPSSGCSPRAHPRMGGEHCGRLVSSSQSRGSPPHGRGTPCGRVPRSGRSRLTPAWAGNTSWTAAGTARRRAHPRMGGEHGTSPVSSVKNLGSPPHGRGTPALQRRPRLGEGLTPAWAGNTSLLRVRRCGLRAHPRMGGEHRRPGPNRSGMRGSPPHGRGTPDRSRTRHIGRGLTPAWAGNTTLPPASCGQPWAHPRMGGEHRMRLRQGDVDSGSPPHGRGTPPADALETQVQRLTPAWAGNTC